MPNCPGWLVGCGSGWGGVGGCKNGEGPSSLHTKLAFFGNVWRSCGFLATGLGALRDDGEVRALCCNNRNN